ncbi:hypothetical protein FKW77_001877 [Venturia effusa]|uniref:Uncharacterized protein n=1 Tax=Venturia effusa TaxID=50376 RepID=A0A517LPR9_9PEZI|nr:hypothetical protein FKW77_001877 [Venturia effusa]
MATGNTLSPIGKLYTMKTRSHCEKDGHQYVKPLGRAAYHMALCISAPDVDNWVTVVTLSTKAYEQGIEFHPIYPNPSSGTTLYLKNFTTPTRPSPLLKPTYLRLEPFPIPLEMLLPVSPKCRIYVPTYHDEERDWSTIDPAWKIDPRDWKEETLCVETWLNGVCKVNPLGWKEELLCVETWLNDEHLELVPESLEFVLGRMERLFADEFPLERLWEWRRGEVGEVGGGRDRLARRMGISRGNLEMRLEWWEGYKDFWRT